MDHFFSQILRPVGHIFRTLSLSRNQKSPRQSNGFLQFLNEEDFCAFKSSVLAGMFVESLPRGIPTARPRQIAIPVDPLLSKLPPVDQAEYIRLANMFAYCEDRNKRNMGMSTFVKHLSMIHAFICRGDAFDALRGVVCGIEFGCSSLLVNTSRLKRLMVRSKSCMNGCFQKLGYNVCRPAHEIATLFTQIMPGYGFHVFTARQWCVRKANEASSLCFLPNIKVEIAAPDNAASPYAASPTEGNAEPEKDKSESPALLFDIRSLLNRQVPVADIQPKTCDSLPPLRC